MVVSRLNITLEQWNPPRLRVMSLHTIKVLSEKLNVHRDAANFFPNFLNCVPTDCHITVSLAELISIILQVTDLTVSFRVAKLQHEILLRSTEPLSSLKKLSEVTLFSVLNGLFKPKMVVSHLNMTLEQRRLRLCVMTLLTVKVHIWFSPCGSARTAKRASRCSQEPLKQGGSDETLIEITPGDERFTSRTSRRSISHYSSL